MPVSQLADDNPLGTIRTQELSPLVTRACHNMDVLLLIVNASSGHGCCQSTSLCKSRYTLADRRMQSFLSLRDPAKNGRATLRKITALGKTGENLRYLGFGGSR